MQWGHQEPAYHDLLKEKPLSTIQYSAELLKVKTTILNSNRTYKTKLSLKMIYNLSFRKCNGKSPSCPLSIGLDLFYWGGFYDRLKFFSLFPSISKLDFPTRKTHTFIWKYISSWYDVHPQDNEHYNGCRWAVALGWIDELFRLAFSI